MAQRGRPKGKMTPEAAAIMREKRAATMNARRTKAVQEALSTGMIGKKEDTKRYIYKSVSKEITNMYRRYYRAKNKLKDESDTKFQSRMSDIRYDREKYAELQKKYGNNKWENKYGNVYYYYSENKFNPDKYNAFKNKHTALTLLENTKVWSSYQVNRFEAKLKDVFEDEIPIEDKNGKIIKTIDITGHRAEYIKIDEYTKYVIPAVKNYIEKGYLDDTPELKDKAYELIDDIKDMQKLYVVAVNKRANVGAEYTPRYQGRGYDWDETLKVRKEQTQKAKDPWTPTPNEIKNNEYVEIDDMIMQNLMDEIRAFQPAQARVLEQFLQDEIEKQGIHTIAKNIYEHSLIDDIYTIVFDSDTSDIEQSWDRLVDAINPDMSVEDKKKLKTKALNEMRKEFRAYYGDVGDELEYEEE